MTAPSPQHIPEAANEAGAQAVAQLFNVQTALFESVARVAAEAAWDEAVAMACEMAGVPDGNWTNPYRPAQPSGAPAASTSDEEEALRVRIAKGLRAAADRYDTDFALGRTPPGTVLDEAARRIEQGLAP